MSGFNEYKHILARLDDCINLCKRQGTPKFLGFLNEAEAFTIKKHIPKGEDCVFYGGYKHSQRVILGVFTGTYFFDNFDNSVNGFSSENLSEVFPISAISFTFPSNFTLNHRDFLGSIMALGIKREAIGDIIVTNGKALVFCHQTVAQSILGLDKIGKVGVDTESGISFEIPEQKFEIISGTINSTRLDCILSLVLKKSRSVCKEFIESGKVTLDYSEILDSSKKVNEGGIISVRGFGKLIFVGSNGVSRKNKIIVEIKKYC